jgi:hypothetical protein
LKKAESLIVLFSSENIDDTNPFNKLSEDEIIEILGLMPSMDLIGTIILSKRWTHLWTAVPNLMFEESFSSDESILNFANKVYFVTDSRMKEGIKELEEFYLALDYTFLHLIFLIPFFKYIIS